MAKWKKIYTVKVKIIQSHKISFFDIMSTVQYRVWYRFMKTYENHLFRKLFYFKDIIMLPTKHFLTGLETNWSQHTLLTVSVYCSPKMFDCSWVNENCQHMPFLKKPLYGLWAWSQFIWLYLTLTCNIIYQYWNGPTYFELVILMTNCELKTLYRCRYF